jgi:trk system potassium uptake protein TrkA
MSRVVIVGGGRVGLAAAQSLDEQGDSVVVVERDSERAASLGGEYVASVIEGDGTDPGVLPQADLERADAVAALTGSAGTNLAVCLLAKRRADVRTVLRVNEPGAVERYDELVDAAVCPERTGALAAVSAVLDAEVEVLAGSTPDVSLRWVRVREEAPVAGRTLSEVALPRGALVVARSRDGGIVGADTALAAGESYLLALEPGVIEEATTLFRG